MKIVQPASSMISQPTLPGAAAPTLPASTFQARLGAPRGGPSSLPGGTPPTGSDILKGMFEEQRAMLLLQYQLTRGTTSLISNVMKTRHETAKNSIQNIR
ncbi:MAG TPA: hypothetical protein VK539_25415 [Myxococcaceae bacterium]|nr:hypothetical protein [Myxococcaceae bacterium]